MDTPTLTSFAQGRPCAAEPFDRRGMIASHFVNADYWMVSPC